MGLAGYLVVLLSVTVTAILAVVSVFISRHASFQIFRDPALDWDFDIQHTSDEMNAPRTPRSPTLTPTELEDSDWEPEPDGVFRLTRVAELRYFTVPGGRVWHHHPDCVPIRNHPDLLFWVFCGRCCKHIHQLH